MSNERVVLIANPVAGGGRVRRELDAVKRAVAEHLAECDVLETRHIGDGVAHARDAVLAGATKVLSLGGDGTHSEVARGIMQAGDARENVHVAFLPAGTGSDFCRMLVPGHDWLDAIRSLKNGHETQIDVGEMQSIDDDGKAHQRFFLNMAGIGASPLVCRKVAASSKALGGKLTYLTSTLSVLSTYKPPRVRVTVDELNVGEFVAHAICVCNGRYAGGGMMFAPEARLADGLFDVIVMEEQSLLRSISMAPAIYKGAHIQQRGIHVFRGKNVKIEALGGIAAEVECDGEPCGKATLDFSIHEKALRVLGVRADVV